MSNVKKKRRKKYKHKSDLTATIYRARLDCLIFFDLIMYGWGQAIHYPNGSVVAVNSPLSIDPRLGYPGRIRLVRASSRVRKRCPEEAVAYKRAFTAWKEARRRYLAASDEKRWIWYTRGQGNTESLAYRSVVASRRRGGYEHYYKLHKYLYRDLLPRRAERLRALKEMREADKIMAEMRTIIFEKMGVPEKYRSKVMSELPEIIKDNQDDVS